jgi:hypothetical protein
MTAKSSKSRQLSRAVRGSRTQTFNALIAALAAALGALSLALPLTVGTMSTPIFLALTFVAAGGNAYLRTLTNGPLPGSGDAE